MSTLLAAQALANTLLETVLSPTGLSPAVEELTSAAASTANDECVVEQLEGAAASLRELPAGLADAVQAVGILESAQSGG